MEHPHPTEIAAPAPQRWWQRFIDKPPGEIALDLTLFVLGVVVLYAVDVTIISRAAPVAIQYLLDLVVYVNHHAVAAVQMLY